MWNSIRPSVNFIYIVSSCCVFGAAAAFKAHLLVVAPQMASGLDPVFEIPRQVLFWFAVALEVAVIMLCVLSRAQSVKISAILWLAAIFGCYRIGLLYLGYNLNCNCFGNARFWLNISQQDADYISSILVLLLLFGGLALLTLPNTNKDNETGKPGSADLQTGV